MLCSQVFRSSGPTAAAFLTPAGKGIVERMNPTVVRVARKAIEILAVLVFIALRQYFHCKAEETIHGRASMVVDPWVGGSVVEKGFIAVALTAVEWSGVDKMAMQAWNNATGSGSGGLDSGLVTAAVSK